MRAWYEWAIPDLGPSPIAERTLAWLEANQPATSTDTVLCWGDSRIGNVMFRDFAPVGVLDWEMATIGPREMDLSWIVFAHMVFESITEVFGFPGMPDFMREEDVQATYAEATGKELGDLTWYHLYNARPVVRGLHAHRRPVDPLRRGRAARGHRDALPPQAADGAAAGGGRAR